MYGEQSVFVTHLAVLTVGPFGTDGLELGWGIEFSNCDKELSSQALRPGAIGIQVDILMFEIFWVQIPPAAIYGLHSKIYQPSSFMPHCSTSQGTWIYFPGTSRYYTRKVKISICFGAIVICYYYSEASNRACKRTLTQWPQD